MNQRSYIWGELNIILGVWSDAMSQEETLVVVQLTKWFSLKLFGETNSLGFSRDINAGIRYVDEDWLMNEVGHP